MKGCEAGLTACCEMMLSVTNIMITARMVRDNNRSCYSAYLLFAGDFASISYLFAALQGKLYYLHLTDEKVWH